MHNYSHLPASFTQEKEIVIVPFYISFDDKTYYKEGIEIDDDEFYIQVRLRNYFRNL